MEAHIHINELLKTGHAVTIVLPSDVRIKGFVTSQFSFAGAAAWGDSNAAEVVEKMNAMSEGGASLKAIVGQEGGGLTSGFRPYLATGKAFQGYTVPTIEIPLIFVAIDKNITSGPFAKDVRAQYRELLRAVFPTDVKGVTGNTNMAKPWNHKFNPLTLDPVGASVSSIQIGTWFISPNFWLISAVSGTFSKEITVDGTPLYANVNVSLTAFRQPRYEEVQRWFGGGGQ